MKGRVLQVLGLALYIGGAVIAILIVSRKQLPTTIRAILYFTPDGTPRVSPLSSGGFRDHSSQPLRSILRVALKPVFDQLGLKWTPLLLPPLCSSS